MQLSLKSYCSTFDLVRTTSLSLIEKFKIYMYLCTFVFLGKIAKWVTDSIERFGFRFVYFYMTGRSNICTKLISNRNYSHLFRYIISIYKFCRYNFFAKVNSAFNTRLWSCRLRTRLWIEPTALANPCLVL